MITRVPGTQDIIDLAPYHQLTTMIRDHFTRAAFEEIATPLIEHTELFTRSLGTGTDIMSKELYFVNSIHASDEERTKLCLRPEATAPILRAYLTNQIQRSPWYAFTIGPIFRHERQQKGRYRQFTQASIECIGTTTAAQDAQLIMLLDRLFAERLQMRHYALLINFMGCPEDRARFLTVLRPFLEAHTSTICTACLQRAGTNPLRVFDCKHETCQALYRDAPQISSTLCRTCAEEWNQLQQLLLQLSVSFSHAPRLVRGLDYYEKTVFEFISLARGEGGGTALGTQNTFCGGGRYNHLALALGASKDIPAIGAGLGIERILMLTEPYLRSIIQQPPLHVIIPTTPAQQGVALHLFDALQSNGDNKNNYRVEVVLTGDSLKSMLRAANKHGATTALLIGPDEQQAGTVTVKWMEKGMEEKVLQRDIAGYMRQQK